MMGRNVKRNSVISSTDDNLSSSPFSLLPFFIRNKRRLWRTKWNLTNWSFPYLRSFLTAAAFSWDLDSLPGKLLMYFLVRFQQNKTALPEWKSLNGQWEVLQYIPERRPLRLLCPSPHNEGGLTMSLGPLLNTSTSVFSAIWTPMDHVFTSQCYKLSLTLKLL